MFRSSFQSLRLFGATICLAAGTSACSSSQQTAEASQLLENGYLPVLDSVLLEERQGRAMAQPIDMAVLPSGELLVADGFNYRIAHYDRSGQLRAVYDASSSGANGAGGIGGILAVTDSSFVTFDFRDKAIINRRLSSGATIWSAPYRGRLSSAVLFRDTLWAGIFDPATKSAVGWWSIAAAPSDTLIPAAMAVPNEYLASKALAAIFDLTSIAVWKDTLVFAYSGLSTVTVLDRTNGQAHHWLIPSRGRLGTSSTTLANFTKGALPFREFFAKWSVLTKMHRLPSGNLALLYFDQHLAPAERHISARLFVDLLKPSTGETCPDRLVQTTTLERPAVAFRADTMMVIENEAILGEPRTVLRRYLLDESACTWSPSSSRSQEQGFFERE